MSRRHLDDFAEISTDWFWETDAEHRFTYLSTGLIRASGFEPAHFTGRTRWEMAGESRDSDRWRELTKALDARQPFHNFTYWVRDIHLSRNLLVRISGQPVFDDEGNFDGYFGIGREITEEFQRFNDLRVKDTMFEQVEKMAQIGYWSLDLTTNNLTWSRQVYELYDLEPDQKLDPDSSVNGIQEPDRTRYLDAVQRSVAQDRPYDLTLRFISAKGNQRWLRVIGQADFVDGRAQRIFGTVQDVSAERERAQHIKEMAHRDPLTGLMNRTLFQERMDARVVASGFENRWGQLCVIDVSRFREINDLFGHSAGDAVLIEIARRLKELSGDKNLVARLGGDEFAILVSQPKNDLNFDWLLNELKAVFDEPVLYRGRKIPLRASFGAAVFPEDGDTMDVLMRRADLALHAAKRLKSKSYVRFQTSMTEAFERRIKVIHEVSDALADRALIPYYQPIVDLKTGEIREFEALIRWRHPERGVVTAGAFYQAFQDRDVAARITSCVLEHVLADISRWKRSGLWSGSVGINLTNHDLVHGHFSRRLARNLKRHGLSPEDLVVELTENIIFGDDGENIQQEISSFAEMGVSLALDDFGTGYASLTHLNTLPVNIIKIDKSFVDDVAKGPGHDAIAMAVSLMAQSFGYQTVAEGIETKDQLDRLRELGCNAGQGYFFSPAVAAADVPSLVAKSTQVWGPMLTGQDNAREVAVVA